MEEKGLVNYFGRDKFSKFLDTMYKSKIKVDINELTEEHLSYIDSVVKNYFPPNTNEISYKDRKKCHNKNKNNSFLTEPKIKIHGWHEIPDLKDLEEITKTRHPSVQNSYSQKSKIIKHQEGLLKHASGIEKILKNPSTLNLPRNLIQKNYTYMSNEEKSKIDLIFETKDTRYLVNYRATDNKNGRKKSIENLELIKNILNHDHINKNTVKIYVSGKNLKSEIIK